MGHEQGWSAILVTSAPGQPSCEELARLAAAGERPRKDYVELARRLGADVIDAHYMAERALPLARAVARRAGLPAGQVAEAVLRRNEFTHILAWADRLGLPLAALFKLTGGRRDLVMVSAWASRAKKALFFRHLKVQTHLRAVVQEGTEQLALATGALGLPREKLRLALPGVDDRFWRPEGGPADRHICSVGWEARDYPTLLRALGGLDLPASLVVGSSVPVAAEALLRDVAGVGTAPQVALRHGLTFPELRALYARSRFVVVPLLDVEYNAGITAIAEAMAMGKAVIATRTGGQHDYIRDGEQGLLVAPGDPAALRGAIDYLMAHPEEAERMGRAGRATVEARFRLDTAVARLAALVRGVAGDETPL